MKTSTVSEVFRVTGLIHILVVSGAHLNWINQLLRPLAPRPITDLFVALYSFLTGFAPPVARAFWQLTLVRLTGRRFTPVLQVALTGAWTWALTSPSEFALSLQLSWTCALILSFCRHLQKFKQITTCTLIFLGLYPLLGAFQPAHPATILINATLSMIFGTFLFPLSLACFVFPPLAGGVDFIWDFTLWFFGLLAASLQMPWREPDSNSALCWSYVIGLQVLLYLVDIHWRRRLWQKNGC